MRPLWMEYPEDFMTFGIDTNYMFGDNILIASSYQVIERTKVYLPPADEWYNFYNSQYQEASDQVLDIFLEQEEIGIYVKAGSIVPRKYTRRMSALDTLQDNYLLDIFLSKKTPSKKCIGSLYFDDGESFDYRTSEGYSLVEIVFENDSLSINLLKSNYKKGQSFVVDQINIFGCDRTPTYVSFLSSIQDSFGQEPNMVYDETSKQIEISNFRIHLLEHHNEGAPIM